MLAKPIAMTATAGETLDYLSHDKGGARTSERVAWSENVNCIEASSEETEKIWAQLVNDAGELKRQAGGSSRGRKLEKPIGHYVIAWAPGERPSREEMVDATRNCMTKLGYRKCMYRIVAHTDRDHPHVHVLVCRVDPENGRAAGRKNDGDKLMQWATDYEKAQGKIRVVGRYEDRINRSRRSRQKRNGETPTPNTPEQNRRRRERRHKRRTTRDALGRPVVLTAPERQEWRKVMTSPKPTAAQPTPTTEQRTQRGERADIKRSQLAKRLDHEEKRANLLELAAAPAPTPMPTRMVLPMPRPRLAQGAQIEIMSPAPTPAPTPMPTRMVLPMPRPRLAQGAQIEIMSPAPTPAPTPMPTRMVLPMPRPRLAQGAQIEIVSPAPRPALARTIPPKPAKSAARTPPPPARTPAPAPAPRTQAPPPAPAPATRTPAPPPAPAPAPAQAPEAQAPATRTPAPPAPQAPAPRGGSRRATDVHRPRPSPTPQNPPRIP